MPWRGSTFHVCLLLDTPRANLGARIPHLRMRRLAWIVVAVVLGLAVAWDFATATTFLGDDYLFRVFARLEANPWVAFTTDKHGGEYYRPLPMLLWWLLERTSGGRAWAFALAALILHALCAGLVAVGGRRMGFPSRTALLAGCLFFAAPAEREAALWFSASTDLLAAAAMMGAMACFLATRKWPRALSVALTALALLCKETALVLPVLLVSACWFRAKEQGRQRSIGQCLVQVLPHLVVAIAYLVVRSLVLHGPGGANDPSAPWWGRAAQLLAGALHSVTAYAPLPEWVAWVAGCVLVGWVMVATRRRGPLAGFAVVWVIATIAPLPAAGWVVGARYFYAPAVGLMLLLALALESVSGLASIFAVVLFLGLGFVSGRHRAGEVRLYRQAVASASAGVAEGLSHGYRLFLVSGSVKDLDLAIKLAPDAPDAVRGAVVIPDVPASFIWLPAELAARLDFLLARPPLPPSGAYHFGNARLVGLARREDAPDLDEVLDRLPELRILHLGYHAGQFSVEDRTSGYRRGHE
jgi:hypothetical protein